MPRAADTGITGPDRTKPELLLLTHPTASASDGIEGRASKKVKPSSRRGVWGWFRRGRGNFPEPPEDSAHEVCRTSEVQRKALNFCGQNFFQHFFFRQKKCEKNSDLDRETVGAVATKAIFPKQNHFSTGESAARGNRPGQWPRKQFFQIKTIFPPAKAPHEATGRGSGHENNFPKAKLFFHLRKRPTSPMKNPLQKFLGGLGALFSKRPPARPSPASLKTTLRL